MEFEDLECPFCAYAAPMVKKAEAQYKIPLVHHDFLIQSHTWSRMAAIEARYLEQKVSPAMAEAFRRDVFANQGQIANRDDLQNFTNHWFQAHGQAMPFVMDPQGPMRDCGGGGLQPCCADGAAAYAVDLRGDVEGSGLR